VWCRMRMTRHDDRRRLNGRTEIVEHSPAGQFPLARLIQLIVLLQTEQCPNARRLADICEVSRRTIYRDLATLAGAGITIVYRPDRQGYELSRHLFLQPLRLEEKEAQALLVLCRQWSQADDLGLYDHANRAVDKLLQSLPDELRERLKNASETLSEVVAIRSPCMERQALYDQIMASLGMRKQIRLALRVSDHAGLETTKFGIYRLPLINGRWCLVGRSTLHCGVVLFPVPQIERIELTSDSYTIPPRFNLARFLAQNSHEPEPAPGCKVVIRLAPTVISRIDLANWPQKSRLCRLDQGAANLEFELESPQKLLPRLLAFGDDLEVLEPEGLRSAMSDVARRIAHRHVTKDGSSSPPAPIAADPDPRRGAVTD
jgi:predicted DNA-binding transcriptional regulator YafY